MGTLVTIAKLLFSSYKSSLSQFSQLFCDLHQTLKKICNSLYFGPEQPEWFIIVAHVNTLLAARWEGLEGTRAVGVVTVRDSCGPRGSMIYQVTQKCCSISTIDTTR